MRKLVCILLMAFITHIGISQDKIVLNPDQYIVKGINYDYDLISGKVNYVYYQQGEEDQLVHKYAYDGDNRITQVHTSTDGINWTRDVAYEYYAHGPLAKAQVGALNVETSVYAYTLQGWIKGVKGQSFSYALGYNNTDYASIGTNTNLPTPVATGKDLYNGNIATWASLNPKINAVTWTQQFTYDQLNRIKTGGALGGTHVDQFRSTYGYDANGNLKSLERWNKSGTKMDEFVYNYEDKKSGYLSNTNKLRSVDDNPAYSGVSSTDLDDQGLGNYNYDDIGNLNKDVQEDIAKIEWTVYGKVKAVYRISDPSTKLPTGDKPHLFFEYDAMGNRVTKYVQAKDGKVTKISYVRDASGNVMSTYASSESSLPLLSEQYLYGSARVGIVEKGSRSYELTDHLGNVRAVVDEFKTVASAIDYYPFGMVAEEYAPSGGYRHGFNGKERDDEIKGGGNSYDFGARMYDSRLGRWWANDPAFGLFPFESPYMYAGNNPVFYIDPSGEWKVVWRDNNDQSKGIVLEAEKGDNLKTLAVQMGIPYQELLDKNFKGKDWSNGLDIQGKWLRKEDLPGVDAFQEINDYLARTDIQETNCANCAMEANGIDLQDAWVNSDGEYDPLGGGESSVVMEETDKLIKTIFEGVTASHAQIGDVITYKLDMMSNQELLGYAYDHFKDKSKVVDGTTGEYTQEYLDYLKVLDEKYKQTDHYSVVLLKTPDGSGIQQVIEKLGRKGAAVSEYNNGQSGDFYASPAPGTGDSPIYHEKK